MAGYLAGDVDEWIYIDIADQHEDSIRFIKDCEKAIGKPIRIIKSEEYSTTEECFCAFGGFKNARSNFAPCTNWLKKRVRKAWEAEHTDYELTYVWGYDAQERERADRLIEANPQADHEFPLIEKELSKKAVHGLFDELFSFSRPIMYDLGYPNNNCIGCIKGGMGYWNKIRRDFPEVFSRRSKLERKLGRSMLKEKDGTPLFLDELDPNRGDINTEIMPECDIMCMLVTFSQKQLA